MEEIAPMIVAVVFILTLGGVLVLRPIAKRLGSLLGAMAKERELESKADARQLARAVESLGDRITLLEERQDFTDRLIGRGDGPQDDP